MGVVDELIRAREAFERRDWVAAYGGLSDAGDRELSADDFAALATVAHLLGRRNDCIQALQRAFQANLDRADSPAAVRSALWLATVLFLGGEIAIANAWVGRAERLLDDVDGDVVERGYLFEMMFFGHVVAGRFDEAFVVGPRVVEYGRRFHDPDLLALGLHGEGRMAIYSGRVADGLRLLDEAMVGVVAGEVSPIYAGIVYCSVIEACQEISDFGRAGEWTHALTTWCDAQPGLVAFTGQCAVHRGQLMRLHGAYEDALDEFERATRRYAEAGGHPAVGLTHRERGDVLRILGDYDAAEDAYLEAVRLGNEAQPGRALLWLARGRTEPAVATMRRLLAEQRSPVHRSGLLAAAVDVLVDGGAADEAEPLAQELTAIGDSFGCSALQAAACHAVGTVALARADPATALGAARRAAGGWARLVAPYDLARSRVLIGRALALLGDEESAAAELTAARNAFAELGAGPAEQEAAELLGRSAVPGGLSPRELEVLRLVAAGRSNAEIAAELVIAEKTVARHLSNMFVKLDVGSRTAAAAFAFEHRLL
ncbi:MULTISPECIES: helix-turn-helix transcriptional regulator [Pseudonocardia]|uniref:Transcriptional regulator, LuxR family n=1 Tax=Pseudonocardia dioxanivorans (strain ATCC 55486 / DSM 44775 / JCM 13855 / CB1190) TaxID=675635 RepID=F4CQ82_PSEUX|nr:LuxR family transcriptional regulator [Pseudonocardia dioxanivorans]AEA28355.1 transcriptional regulator, LuxR family [Pseudonocardia dioxanivorans CB1190]GJF05925.1 helix-turn-helix transcriptional regulator [Pseudonocardia sp. D17]